MQWAAPGRLRRANRGQQQGRDEIRHGVHRRDDNGGGELRDPAAHTEGSDLGDGRAGRQAAIGRHQLLAAHQGWEVGTVGHIEEDGQEAMKKGDQVQLLDTQSADKPGAWDGAEQGGPEQIGGDEHRAPAQAIYPRPDDEPAEQRRQHGGGGQQRQLERRGRQGQDRRELEGTQQRAGDGDGLGGPQLEKVAVPPQTARPGGRAWWMKRHCRRYLSHDCTLAVHPAPQDRGYNRG